VKKLKLWGLSNSVQATKGCWVTRRSIRAGSRYFSRKVVTGRGEYGVVFAVRVQVLLHIRVSRYKVDRKQE